VRAPGWSVCPTCEGTGGLWNASEEAIRSARSRLLAEYPDAGAPQAPADFTSPTLAHNLATGEIVDLGREQRARDPGGNKDRKYG
jgi:hypothetical protein